MGSEAVEAVQLLERVHTGNSPAPLHDDGMVVEWIDREIGSFIAKHGPLREVIARLEAEEVVTCKVCGGHGKAWGPNPNKPCEACGGAGKVRVKHG